MSTPTPERKRPAHYPVVERFNCSNIIFVTVCTHERKRVLANAEARQLLEVAWRQAGIYLVGRYVIMPDHVHLFCAPGVMPVESLKRWVKFWKAIAALKWPGAAEGKLWQRDYWDTQLRRGDSYTAKWEYVRQNPVRAGLVKRAEDWPYQGELNVLNWRG